MSLFAKKLLSVAATVAALGVLIGLYVADCPSMAYKARYLPHERLINGEWVKFSRASLRNSR